jgi:hypothetical protein
MAYKDVDNDMIGISTVFFIIFLIGPIVIGSRFNSDSNGKDVVSAILSPFRHLVFAILSLFTIFESFGTYVVRRQSWPVLLRMSTGFEGYPLDLPAVEQRPLAIPDDYVKYENIPLQVEQRALHGRGVWVQKHLEDVTETFAKLSINVADVSSLLRIIESDETLVHGAYYTDDECIDRIAAWIAGTG